MLFFKNMYVRFHLTFSICTTLLITSHAYGFETDNLCYKAYRAHEYNAALLSCTKQADEGDSGAALRLYFIYYDGKGTDKDPGKQFQYLKKAEALGDENVHYLFNVYCAANVGAKSDLDYACKKLQEDVYKKHYIASQNILGAVLLRGSPLPQNVAEAFRLFNMGAHKKDPSSMVMLGMLAQKKLSPTQEDYMESYMWLKLGEKYKNSATIDGITEPLMTQYFADSVRKMVEDFGNLIEEAKSHLSEAELQKAEAMFKSWPLIYNKDTYGHEIVKHFSYYQYFPDQPANMKTNEKYLVVVWMDRSGKVLSHEFQKPVNKHNKFTEAIDKILAAASPFPPAPADYEPNEKKLKIEMLINFEN